MRVRYSVVVAAAMIAASTAAAQGVTERVVKRPDGTVIHPTAVDSTDSRAVRLVPDQVVKRPDGSVVQPPANEYDDNRAVRWLYESQRRADERERIRLEGQSSREARIEQSQREREAAYQNPARQIAPTVGQ